MKSIKKTVILALFCLFQSPVLWAAVYQVDRDHTTVSFKIRHMFSYVQGEFTDFAGKIEFDPDKPETWKTDGTIQTTSINTRVPERDKHLRSKDFFDVEQFPQIVFKSTQVTGATKTGAKLEGLITIHGVEKPIVLDVQIHGVGKDPWGNVRSGFTATAKLNRKDFGLTWNQVLETGEFLVGDEVIITIEVEGLEA